MKQQNTKRNRGSAWNRIPTVRRHVYVYTLLLLGAIVGNNVKNSIAGTDNDTITANAGARLAGMKSTADSLYR